MITTQANLFLIFIINGILIGILFDIFRILRKSFKTNDIITYVEDTLFWVVSGIIILYSIFIFNNGEIRLFIFLAIIVGIAIYMFLFSKYFIKINLLIIGIIKKIISFIWQTIKAPFKFILKVISKPIIILVINVRKRIRQIYTKTLKTSMKKTKKRIIFQKNKENTKIKGEKI